LETPSSARTAWFTSSRRVAFTTHAPNFLGSFFEATTMVLPALSRGSAYFSQHAAVSAKAGEWKQEFERLMMKMARQASRC